MEGAEEPQRLTMEEEASRENERGRRSGVGR